MGDALGNLAHGDASGAKGIPNHVEEWGAEWDHDWPTWQAMLPLFLERLTG